MFLSYENKKTEKEILENTKTATFASPLDTNHNLLIHGDNLPCLKSLLENYSLKSKIDLIYIDPPFATGGIFSVGTDRTSTMSKSQKDEVAYFDKLTGSDFLEFLRERLVFARELLSERGSIYLHIDYKIGHYVKIIMDEIFGQENFRNDISRVKCNPKNFERRAYGNEKDLILFYSKTKNNIWNEPKVQYSDEDIKRLFKKVDKHGRRYTTIPLHAPGETKNGESAKSFKGVLPPKGRHWRSAPTELEKLDEIGLIEWSKNGVPRKIIFADEQVGKKLQDIWQFKDAQYPSYPTEKNLEMLLTIIRASSDLNSTVLDFFCGSGTALLASEICGRKWIGIDNSEKAIEITQKKMKDAEYDFVESFCGPDSNELAKKYA